MKRLLKTWVFWAFLALPLGLAPPFFLYRDRSSFVCPGCSSWSERSRWRGGLWAGPSIGLWSAAEVTTDSRFLDDFLGGRHEHAWEFVGGGPDPLLGGLQDGCARGGGRLSRAAEYYEGDRCFRGIVRRAVERGEASRDDVIAALRLPDVDDSDPAALRLQRLGEAWISELETSHR